MSNERAREDALAQALCLLDTFAGEGLLHTYGNGQTIDAADACTELAEAFGIECEPGWYRTLAAAFTQEAGWMPIEQAPRDGTVCVPIEPTNAMIIAGAMAVAPNIADCPDDGPAAEVDMRDHVLSEARQTWDAMIAARPLPAPPQA